MSHVFNEFRRSHYGARALLWLQPEPGARRHGRLLTIRRARRSTEYPVTVAIISPRLLLDLLRASEDVVIVQELNLSALFAILSKVRNGRRVVTLIEGNLNELGRTGSAAWKTAFRKLIARGVDVFVANSSAARRYLTTTLSVADRKVVEGWWLAGLPAHVGEDDEHQPYVPWLAGNDGPTFLTAGRLIPQKGIHLLIDAVARYRKEVGPCRLWVAGEGPLREGLIHQAQQRGVGDCVDFLGTVAHGHLERLFRACDAFVFPTLRDLVGRVVVEALSTGTPVVLSRWSGAAGTLVQDGENGFVVDPQDTVAFTAALRRVSLPQWQIALREEARRTSARLTPAAAAEVIHRSVELARQ